MGMPSRYLHNGYYDPDPQSMPWGLIIVLCVVVIGAVAWSNPAFLEQFIKLLNPQFAELEEEEQKKQREFYRTMLSVLIGLGVLVLLVFLWQRSKNNKTRRMIRHG